MKKRNTMIALREQSRGAFSSFMFTQGLLARLVLRRGCLGTRRLFFSAQGGVVNDSAVKEAKSETKAGAGHLNDAPSGRGRLATCEVGRLSFAL